VTEELTPLEETTGETALAAAKPAAPRQRELSPREAAILESIDRLANGHPAQPDVVKPTQAMAALIRLLIKKGLVSEIEFLDELTRK
jgi:chorismate mutase